MFKKVMALLLVGYLLLLQTGMVKVVADNNEAKNLKEFLSTLDEVTIKYDYPGMKLAAANTKGVVLPAGTPIILRTNETLSTESLTSGTNVRFSVVSDVIVDGQILIKSGSQATAQVSYSKRKNYGGTGGEVSVSDFSVNAIDGAYIPLTASISAKGEEKVGLTWGLGLLICPLFLLMKGEDATIPAGTTKSVYTLTNVTISPERI